MSEFPLQEPPKRGKIMTVENGFVACPICRRNRRMFKITSRTRATDLLVYCRVCKTQHIVNIEQGQCYLSQSQ